METTFWGFIQMNIEQAERIKEYLTEENYDNKMIDKDTKLVGSSRGITLVFAKVVRGGYEERDFWFNEFENFLKKIEAIYSTVCFEYDDKDDLFVYDYLFNTEKMEWEVYEYKFTRQLAAKRVIKRDA